MLDDGHVEADRAMQAQIVRQIEKPPKADPVAIVTLRIAKNIRMRRARPRIARAHIFRQILIMLDIRHDPQRHAGAIRPAQRRPLHDRRISDQVGIHDAASFSARFHVRVDRGAAACPAAKAAIWSNASE